MMMTEDKKKVGRPRKYAGKRPTWTIRLEEKYGDQVKALAQETGRSISEVCERQIVDSFRQEIIIDLLEKEIGELRASNEQLSRASQASETRIYGLIEKLNDGYQRVHGLSTQIDNLTMIITKLAAEKK
jgi:hypothetical protein